MNRWTLTARGWTLTVGGLAWCAVAAVAGQRDLWWPGLLLILLPVSSWLLLLPGNRGLTPSRQVVPRQVSAGEPVWSEVVVEAPGAGLGAIVTLRDHLDPALGDDAVVELPVGWGLWEQRAHYQVRPAWRGRHRFGPLDRVVRDGLGLALRSTRLPGSEDVAVTPAIVPLRTLSAITGVGAASPSSALRSSLAGPQDALIRDYRSGDDVRRIHWRSTARTGALMVRREESSWDPSAVLLVDNRAVGYGASVPDDRFEWVVSATASIAVHLLDAGFAVTLVDAAGRQVRPDTGAGGSRSQAVLSYLTDLALVGEDSLERALVACPPAMGSQFLIGILGSLSAADAGALRAARGNRSTCWALLVEPEEAGAVQRARDALERDGWRTLAADSDTPIAEAWDAFAEAAR